MNKTTSPYCVRSGCMNHAVKGTQYCPHHNNPEIQALCEQRDLEQIVGVHDKEKVAVRLVNVGTSENPELKFAEDMPEQSSGGDNDYWVANVTHPKRLAPYKVEAEDLIELFQFSFAEGNALKALFRMGMDRVASGKPGDTPLRNAEKVEYYGGRMVVAEKRKVGK